MSPELPTLRSELNQWVGPELAQQAGFRGEGVFSQSFGGKDFSYRIYSGFIPNPDEKLEGLHIAVGVKVKEGKKITWYFATFEAKAWRDMTQEEAERYVKIEQRSLSKGNIIQPRMLENLIRQTLESYQDK